MVYRSYEEVQKKKKKCLVTVQILMLIWKQVYLLGLLELCLKGNCSACESM